MNNKKIKEFQVLEQYDYVDDEYIYKVAEKYAPKIGLFLISFSFLEHSLNVSIAEMVSSHSHDTGYQIIEKLGFKDKIDLFFKLYSQPVVICNLPKYKKQLDCIKSKLNSINKFRNIVAHSSWYSMTKDRKVRTKIIVDSTEGTTKFQIEKITLTMFSENTRELDKLIDEIDEFHDAVFQAL